MSKSTILTHLSKQIKEKFPAKRLVRTDFNDHTHALKDLTHLSKQIKRKFPAKWLVSIDLNDHTVALRELKEKRIDKEKMIELVSKRLLKLKPGLKVVLFKQCCEQNQKVIIIIIIMLDGFDEIIPNNKKTLIRLLQALRQTAVEQLWVTIRPHLTNELEDVLQQLSYTLEPFF